MIVEEPISVSVPYALFICISHVCLFMTIVMKNIIQEHICHVLKMSVSGYIDRQFKTKLHKYVVSFRKTLNLHCIS